MLKNMFVFQDQIVSILDVKGCVCVSGSDCFYSGCQRIYLCYRIRLFLFWMLKDMFVFQDQIVSILDVTRTCLCYRIRLASTWSRAGVPTQTGGECRGSQVVCRGNGPHQGQEEEEEEERYTHHQNMTVAYSEHHRKTIQTWLCVY